jgi:hypothetical protein
MINFDEATHTYTRNGNQYTSVTTLLNKYGLSPSYANIPQNVLQQAATRGSNTHKVFENYIKQGLVDPNDIDLANFIKYITARNIDVKTSISEEIVYDDTYLIAGTIDWQYIDLDEEVIADFKTTSQIHWESVTWQLSIYNFIKCKGDIIQYYIKKLKVIHICNGKLNVKELPTIDYDEVVKLLTANLTGAPYVYQPDFSNILSNSESIMLSTIIDDITQCETLLNDLKKKKEAMTKTITERMVAHNQHECTVNNLRIKYSDPTTRKTLDIDKVKILCNTMNVDINSLYKVSDVAGKMTITKK